MSQKRQVPTTVVTSSGFPDRENFIQIMSAFYLTYYKLILNLPSVILCLFCGAWSDRAGRKILVLLSSFETIVAVLFFKLSLHVNNSSGSVFVLVLVGAAVRGAIGKSAVMTMAKHSYVSDVSSDEVRTQKIGSLMSMSYFGYFAGSLLAGVILKMSGFDVIFLPVLIFSFICVIVTVLFIRESAPAIRHQSETDILDLGQAKTETNVKSRILFRWKFVQESIEVSQWNVFRKAVKIVRSSYVKV